MINFNSNKNSISELLFSYFDFFWRKHKNYDSFAEVISVDENNKTCKCQIVDGELIEDVYLQSVANDNGLLIKPVVGSQVIVSWIDQTTAYVSMYSEIEVLVYQNGNNGGLVKVSDLVSKLNIIENDINNLKSFFSSWVVVPNDGGAALKSITLPWYNSHIANTTVPDLENEKFQH